MYLSLGDTDLVIFGRVQRAFLAPLQRSTAVFRVVVYWNGANMRFCHKEIASARLVGIVRVCMESLRELARLYITKTKQAY